MSDNPDSNTSIYNLLINSDPEVVETLSAQLAELTAKGMSINEAFEQVNASANKAAEGLEKVAEQSKQGVTQTTSDVKNLTTQLADATEQADKLKAALPTSLPEQGYLNAFPFSNFQTSAIPGATMGGGGGGQAERVNELIAQMREQAAAPQMPGPEMFPGLDKSGGGSGSLFGVGHALSVAGFMTGAPGLKEAGALVYMEEGLKRVMPLLQQFGGVIAESSPALTGVVTGFTGLSLPMAGLLAVAVPLTVAVGGILIAWTLFENSLKDGREALKNALGTQMEYFQAVKTMTTEEAKTRVTELQAKVAGDKEAQAETQRTIEALQKQTNINMELGKTLPGSLGDPFRQLSAQLDINNAAISKDNAELGRFTGGLESNAFAANDAAAAAEKLWKALDEAALKGAEDTKSHVLEGLKYKEMADKGEVDSAKSKSQDLKDELAATDAAWLNLLKNGDKNSQAVQDQLKAYSDQHNKLAADIAYLDGTIIPAAQHAKDLADALKASDEAFQKAAEAQKTYEKAVEDSAVQLANQKADAATKEAEAEKALTVGSIQDTYQRSQIHLAESRKETALAQDTANAILDVRTKLGQKEIADLTNYNRQIFDDQTKYQQDIQKDQTKAYRDEQDNLVAHQQKLADIQNKEAASQQDALLNRNFLALAKVQQGKQGEIDAEDMAYARKQAAVQQNLQRELADLATHQAETRTQQFVEYQRKLVDDRLAAQREIDQKHVDEQRKLETMRLSETQQLQDLTTAETYKIQILRQGFAQEIALYELQAQRRLQIAAQTDQQAAIQAWKASGGSQGAATALGLFSRDSGGPFGAGETFVKGDIQEMFSFGSKSYSIPGAAIVHPLQSGNATPMQGGGNNITIPISISRNSQDPAREASQQVYAKLKEFFVDQ